jgi:hypothetical protein
MQRQPGLGDQIRRFQLTPNCAWWPGIRRCPHFLPCAIGIYDHLLYREAQARAFLMLDQLDSGGNTVSST